MIRLVLRSLLLIAVAGVIGASTFTLFAGPDLPADLADAGSSALVPAASKGWIACPVPPCMMPCVYPPEPEVLCKTKEGTFVTSFACCCCGGSAGTKYRWL